MHVRLGTSTRPSGRLGTRAPSARRGARGAWRGDSRPGARLVPRRGAARRGASRTRRTRARDRGGRTIAARGAPGRTSTRACVEYIAGGVRWETGPGADPARSAACSRASTRRRARIRRGDGRGRTARGATDASPLHLSRGRRDRASPSAEAARVADPDSEGEGALESRVRVARLLRRAAVMRGPARRCVATARGGAGGATRAPPTSNGGCAPTSSEVIGAFAILPIHTHSKNTRVYEYHMCTSLRFLGSSSSRHHSSAHFVNLPPVRLWSQRPPVHSFPAAARAPPRASAGRCPPRVPRRDGARTS